MILVFGYGLILLALFRISLGGASNLHDSIVLAALLLAGAGLVAAGTLA